MDDKNKELLDMEVQVFFEETLQGFDEGWLQFYTEQEIAYVFEIMEEKFRREMQKLKSDYAIVNTKSLEDSGG